MKQPYFAIYELSEYIYAKTNGKVNILKPIWLIFPEFLPWLFHKMLDIKGVEVYKAEDKLKVLK